LEKGDCVNQKKRSEDWPQKVQAVERRLNERTRRRDELQRKSFVDAAQEAFIERAMILSF